MLRPVSHFHGRYNSVCLHFLKGNHTANHAGKSWNMPLIIPCCFGPKKPKNCHHTTLISTSPVSPPLRTHDPRQNSPPWERCDERERRLWREKWDERERERERERESNMWIKKYYFVLELCYSAILKVELRCSTIAKKFAILGISVP